MAANDATRLVQYMEQGLNFEHSAKTGHVWATMFGLISDVDQEMSFQHFQQTYLNLGLLAETIDTLAITIARMTNRDDEEKELYNRSLLIAGQYVQPQNLEMQWQHFRQMIKPEVVIAAKLCSKALPSEQEIDGKTVNQWAVSFQELIGEVDKADMPPILRNYIKHLLSLAVDAINQHSVFGPKRLRKYLGLITASFADLYVEPQIAEQNKHVLIRIAQAFKTTIDEVGGYAQTAYVAAVTVEKAGGAVTSLGAFVKEAGKKLLT